MNSIIEIYCDGGCRGNQDKENVGGWGAVLLYREHRSEIYGSELNTTNNRMEITAVIEALLQIINPKFPVKVYLDSAYVLQGIAEWLPKWKYNGWKTANKKSDVKNKDLWVELDYQVSRFPAIEFIKVKGHSGVEFNEIADKLANRAMDELQTQC